MFTLPLHLERSVSIVISQSSLIFRHLPESASVIGNALLPTPKSILSLWSMGNDTTSRVWIQRVCETSLMALATNLLAATKSEDQSNHDGPSWNDPSLPSKFSILRYGLKTVTIK